MKGKPWTREEEQRLREMVQQGASLKDLAKAFNRQKEAIRMKLNRLGVEVVVRQKLQKPRTTTSELLPANILTHEQALKLLAGALTQLQQPGQDKLELQRLRILVDALQAYDSVLEKFERWSEIESRFAEMDRKIAELEKSKKLSA